MLDTLRMSPQAGGDFESTVTELIQSTSRALFVTTGLLGLAWYTVAAVTLWWEPFVPRIGWVAIILGLTALLAIHVLPTRVFLSQWIWLVGLMAGITAAFHLFEQREVAFSYALLPLMAAMTIGWRAGLIVEAATLVVLVSLSASESIGHSLSTGYGLGISAAGLVGLILGWAAARTLLIVVEWSLFYCRQAQERVAEALDQRIELKQTQEDLVLANRELARLSDRLKELQLQAEESRRAKEEFVANVSHELRTPLNMIIGFSEIMTKSPEVYGVQLPASLLSDIAAIQRNSQHLSRLVNDVLDLSRMEAGRVALNKERIALGEIVEEAVQIVQALYDSKRLYLRIDVPPDLPTILCDGTRIRQVLINLLSNSGRFTEKGGVQVRARSEGDDVVVGIADTGPGIPEEDQERLFEPFEQLDNSIRRQHGGSGLGLSISRELVELHRGKMWITSEVGRGTEICFSLPLQASLPDGLAAQDLKRWFHPYYEYEARTERSKAPPPTALTRFVSLDRGGSVERLLSRYSSDVEVFTVRTMEDAIQELSRSPAQALIVNGYPLMEVPHSTNGLARLPWGTPALVLWMPDEHQAAQQLGVARYLIKPVTRDVLLSALEDLGTDVQSVLLVDDDVEVLRLFARMLSLADRRYQVLRARTGMRALELLRGRQPDVMILDLLMPEMSGFQVLHEKSQDPAIRDIPVVVVSAQDPTGAPLMSDVLILSRGGGLSVDDLWRSIESLSVDPRRLQQSAHPVQPATPAG